MSGSRCSASTGSPSISGAPNGARPFHNRAHELLDDVGLSEFATTPAVEMPYGRKRALEIATTLALDPK